MRTYERILEIEDIVLRTGVARTPEMMQRYGKSRSTIQRYFNALKEKSEGLIEHKYGMAVRVDRPAVTPSIVSIGESDVEAKAIMAVAHLVRDDQAIILEGGTTSVLIAQHLPKNLRLVVVTNSPLIALTVSKHLIGDVWVLGSKLRGDVLIPDKREEFQILQKVSGAELCVLGACNLDLKKISTPDSEHADIKMEMISKASKVVVPVSNESLDSASSYYVGPISKVTHIIPASNVPDKKLRPYEKLGIQIIRG